VTALTSGVRDVRRIEPAAESHFDTPRYIDVRLAARSAEGDGCPLPRKKLALEPLDVFA